MRQENEKTIVKKYDWKNDSKSVYANYNGKGVYSTWEKVSLNGLMTLWKKYNSNEHPWGFTCDRTGIAGPFLCGWNSEDLWKFHGNQETGTCF